VKKFKWIGAVALVVAAFGSSALAADIVVIEPVGNKPCVVAEKDTVRITATGISGSKVKVDVTDGLKVAVTTNVIKKAGGQVVIGGFQTEYDISVVAKGKQKVTVTITPPQPDAKPIVTEYALDVQ
jgi:hypothetical protein